MRPNEDLQATMPQVSVILPVYRPGAGFSRCLQSLREQTLRDIEILVVDDCGGDDALSVAESAAAADARIRILQNHKHLGAGPSRNRGIAAARGAYLSFVDADDFVAPDFLELLLARAKTQDLDIVKGSFATLAPGAQVQAAQKQERILKLFSLSQEKKVPLWRIFTWEHQTALYRRSLVLNSGARYGSAIVSEDTTFLLQVCFAAARFALEERAVYYYVLRPDSALRSFKNDRLAAQLLSLREQASYLEAQGAEEADACQYLLHQILHVLSIQTGVCVLPGREEDAARFLQEIRTFVSSLFCCASLQRESVAIRALLRDGTNLSYRLPEIHYLHPPLLECLQIVETWAGHLEAHPRDRLYLPSELNDIFARAQALCEKGDDTEAKKRLLYAWLRIRRIPLPGKEGRLSLSSNGDSL